jgi:hypothetical protein
MSTGTQATARQPSGGTHNGRLWAWVRTVIALAERRGHAGLVSPSPPSRAAWPNLCARS